MTLPISERAKVARHVTNSPYKVRGRRIMIGGIHIKGSGEVYGGLQWSPKFNPEKLNSSGLLRRSQAVALVEWICKYVQSNPLAIMGSGSFVLRDMSDYVSKGDTAALESLVHELMEKP